MVAALISRWPAHKQLDDPPTFLPGSSSLAGWFVGINEFSWPKLQLFFFSKVGAVHVVLAVGKGYDGVSGGDGIWGAT